MPQPTASDVHVNGPLSSLSVAHIQSQSDFIADRVFPNIPVSKQSDLYFTYDKEYWFRSEAAKRAPGTESAGSGYTVDTDSYRCDVYAVHKDVDDQIRANTDTPLDADRDATLFVTQQLLLKRDQDWAASYFTTGVWGTDLTGVTGTPSTGEVKQWDQSGSDPIGDIQDEKLRIKRLTGRVPNTLVIGPEVENILLQHTSILDRIKYTQRGIISLDLIAALFGVERVLVASAIENSANEGAAVSMGFVFGKAALLCYSAPNPGVMTPSAGYTFSWSGLFGAQGLGTRVSRFRMEQLKSDRIEGEMAYDMKVVSSDLGVYYSGVVG